MGRSKLRSFHVIIIGVLASALVSAGIFFVLIKPKQEEIKALTKRFEAAKQVADQLPQAQERLAKAEQRYAMLLAELERYMIEKMPPISFKDRMAGMYAYWIEIQRVLGPKLQAWPKRTGVKLNSSFQISGTSMDPNTVSNSSFIRLPMGTVSVEGDYKTILSHIRSWNKFDRVVQIDPVSFSGTSPNLTAQYNLTVYIIPQEDPGPQIGIKREASSPPARGRAGGPAGPSGPGGPPGMMMPGMGPGPGGTPQQRR